MSRGIKILLIVMLIVDVAAFLPSLAGWAGAAFLWDDPNVKAVSWSGILRLVLTVLLMAAPFCIFQNFVLAGNTLRRSRRAGILTWVSFVPALLVAGGVVYFFVDDMLDTMKTRRVERSYEAIVAVPQMAQFHALTKNLSPYVRLALALRAQQRLKEQGITPPATVDDLYADEYRVLLAQTEAFKRGAISKSEYDLQHGLEWEDELEISTTLGKPKTFPEQKLFDLPN